MVTASEFAQGFTVFKVHTNHVTEPSVTYLQNNNVRAEVVRGKYHPVEKRTRFIGGFQGKHTDSRKKRTGLLRNDLPIGFVDVIFLI